MKLIDLGRGVCVPQITVRDMIEECEKAWHWERGQLVADLEASAASPSDRLDALQKHTLRRGTALVLLMATMRLDTAERLLRNAIKKAGSDPDEILCGMTPREMVDKAAELCGYSTEPGNVKGPATAA